MSIPFRTGDWNVEPHLETHLASTLVLDLEVEVRFVETGERQGDPVGVLPGGDGRELQCGPQHQGQDHQ